MKLITHNPDYEKDFPPLNKMILDKLDKAKLRSKRLSRNNNLNSIKDPELRRVLTFRSKENKRFIGKYTKWLSHIHQIELKTIRYFVRLMIAIYEKTSVNRGSLKACQQLKELYSLCLRYCSSHNFTRISFMKCDSQGLPLIVKPMKRLMNGTLDQRKCALSILQLYKIVETVNENPDYNTISNKSRFPLIDEKDLLWKVKPGMFFKHLIDNDPLLTDSSKFILDKFSFYWSKVLNGMFPYSKLDQRKEDVKKNSCLFVSSKNGPNGPAISSITLDWIALVNDFALLGEDSILVHIMRMAKLTSNKRLRDIIRNIHKISVSISIERNENGKRSKYKDEQLICHSRICLKQEVGGKVRLFAINDWFSQSALAGLHEFIFKKLKSFPEDGSFSHNRVAHIVRDWTIVKPTSDASVRSIDLTAATDRLVAQLQFEIMYKAFGVDIAYAWYKISTNRYFMKHDRSNYTKYSVGQPMGLLSSWANLALWHHVTVRACCSMLGIVYNDPDNVQYVIIGDDVAIRNPMVAKLYQRILEIIDLPTSKLKGFSEETVNMDLNPVNGFDFIHAAEIAKRVFINGTEITPVPPEAIKASLEDPSDFPSVLFNLEERGYRKLSLEDVDILSKLSYKPSKSLLTATFPLSPCPQVFEINERFIDGERIENEFKIFWYESDIHPRALKKLFNLFIYRKLVNVYKEVDSLIDRYLKYDETFMDHKYYSTNNNYFPVIMKMIGDDSKKTFRKIVMQKENPFVNDIPDFDLKRFIGSLFVIFDIKDALLGILNFKDQKKRTSELIYDFSKYVEHNLEYLKSIDYDMINFKELKRI